MSAVRIENIYKTYNDHTIPTPALKGISLEIGNGEFVVVAGPSGSGKTTLMNIIGTLDRPDSGEVFLDNRGISGLSQNSLARVRLTEIGFVFQSLNLIDVLTARENVEYVMLLQGVSSGTRREQSMEIMKSMGLQDLMDRKTHEMSGGQRQRVAVARAVVGRPRLILADEPTANLDSENGEALISLMEHINRSQGITFMISSHDPLVIRHAKRVIRLKDGTIENDATPQLGR
jgi:putative ABC transport system ATP-binding protein